MKLLEKWQMEQNCIQVKKTKNIFSVFTKKTEKKENLYSCYGKHSK